MSHAQDKPAARDPLHGITLAVIVETLVQTYGWEALGHSIPVRCFLHDPSLASSLTFLRRTPWARQKVEALYLAWQQQQQPRVLRFCKK